MESYDKDRRFMAARDLTALISSSAEVSTNDETQRSLVNAFIKHIDDVSVEVQGNAISLLPTLVLQVTDTQLGMLLKSFCSI